MSKKPRVSARKEPQQERSASLVESIKTAALRVFSKDNYDIATTTKIAQIAGVSIGSLYQYFPGKDAILRALIEERSKEQQRALDLLLSQAADEPLDLVLEKIIRLVAEPAHSANGLSRTFYQLGLALGAAEPIIESRRIASEAIIRNLQMRGDHFTVDLKTAVPVLINSVLGAIGANIIETAPIDSAELIKQLTRMSLLYLAGSTL